MVFGWLVSSVVGQWLKRSLGGWLPGWYGSCPSLGQMKQARSGGFGWSFVS
jgi:hypothetical protein